LSHRNYICRIGVAVTLLVAGGPIALAQSTGAPSGPEIWDVNRDGIYTCDEWKKYLDRIFTAADRNHDGVLDQSEFAAVRKAGTPLADAEFGYFDENQDGKIPRKEFDEKPNEFILKYDVNGDCRVTPEEVRAVNAPKGPQGPSERKRDLFH
jgi:Ca2+-binding EF-hand superfamily protein